MKSLVAGASLLVAFGWRLADPSSPWARLATIVCGMATIAAVLTSARGSVKLLAAAVILVALVFVWIFRYEEYNGVDHRNRITGTWCAAASSCW
jgi:Flp pilus assembly protein TadB